MSKVAGAIFKTAANHIKGSESVGGKLYLIQDALVFISHVFNIQRHELAIPISEIAELVLTKNMGLVPNGLTVRLKNGMAEKFVVNKRKVWVEKIEALRGVKE